MLVSARPSAVGPPSSAPLASTRWASLWRRAASSSALALSVNVLGAEAGASAGGGGCGGGDICGGEDGVWRGGPSGWVFVPVA